MSLGHSGANPRRGDGGDRRRRAAGDPSFQPNAADDPPCARTWPVPCWRATTSTAELICDALSRPSRHEPDRHRVEGRRAASWPSPTARRGSGLAVGSTTRLGGRRIRVTESGGGHGRWDACGEHADHGSRVSHYRDRRSASQWQLIASMLCSTTPARALGAHRRFGELALKGRSADVVVLDRNFQRPPHVHRRAGRSMPQKSRRRTFRLP